MMKRILGVIIVMALVMLILSGCTQTEVKYELREDGSGSFYGKIAVQQLAYLMMSEALGELNVEDAAPDLLIEMQDSFKRSGADVSDLKVYTGADTYVGFDFVMNIDDALTMEVEGNEGNVVGLFEGFTLIRNNNGDNILSFKIVDFCDSEDPGTTQGMYAMMSLDIDGELISSTGFTVDETGVVYLEQGDKDAILTFDSSTGGLVSSESFNINLPCEPTDIEVSWKISDTLYEKLAQFPSINSTAFLTGNSWYGSGVLGGNTREDFYWPSGSDPHPFTDVIGHPQEDALIDLWNKQVINGTTPTTMSPDDLLTREQAVTLLYNAYGLDSRFAYEKELVDVDDERYSYNAIQWALGFGISTGTNVDSAGRITFEPESILTREQAIALLNNILLYHDNYRKISETVSTWHSLNVSGASSWAHKAVENLYSSDILTLEHEDMSSSYFKSGATRAYFAELLAKALTLYNWQ